MKKINFVQINIYRGMYLTNLLKFLKDKNSDIITMQEVTSGKLNFYKDQSLDLFLLLKRGLGINGKCHRDLKLSKLPNSKLGNAVFSMFEVLDSRVITLKKFRPVTSDELDGNGAFKIRPLLPRHILDVSLNVEGNTLHVLSAHGAWTAPPCDTQENLRQAKLIKAHLELLNKDNQPFILGGDLNMPPDTKVIEMIGSVSNNLMLGSPFGYTTHPKIHKIAPRKFLVDYVFTSKHFKLLSLDVPEVTVSDHLPVVAKLEVMEN